MILSFTRDAEKIDKKGRMKMSVGANIKKRRFELNMSQQDLADAMGYKTRSTIAKIESGENDVTQKRLTKFAEVLDTTVEALMGITTPPATLTTTYTTITSDKEIRLLPLSLPVVNQYATTRTYLTSSLTSMVSRLSCIA